MQKNNIALKSVTAELG